MKKLYSIGVLMTGLLLLTHINCMAQTGKIQVGGGLIFGSGVLNGSGASSLNNNVGLKADGYYTINEKFRAGVGLNFFFPHSDSGVKFSIWNINLNGNYFFYENEATRLYGLAGINIASMKTTYDSAQFGTASGTDSETGLNLGGGAEFGLDFANLFGELKFAGIGGNADQLVLNAGLRFAI